jgi:hypothetical protein
LSSDRASAALPAHTNSVTNKAIEPTVIDDQISASDWFEARDRTSSTNNQNSRSAAKAVNECAELFLASALLTVLSS